MYLLYRRLTRTGAAPLAFYVAMATAFAALAVYAAVRGDWLILAIAVVMVAVTAAGSRVMRRMHVNAGDADRDTITTEGHDDVR